MVDTQSRQLSSSPSSYSSSVSPSPTSPSSVSSPPSPPPSSCSSSTPSSSSPSSSSSSSCPSSPSPSPSSSSHSPSPSSSSPSPSASPTSPPLTSACTTSPTSSPTVPNTACHPPSTRLLLLTPVRPDSSLNRLSAKRGRPSAAPGGRGLLGWGIVPAGGGEALRALVGERGAAWEAVVRVEVRETSESAGRARGVLAACAPAAKAAVTAASGCRCSGV
ncbi:unnamed protein product [Closterium sp. Yama58-4]|nr:unnamed protein product [Closterium sp. Yama58-4]